VLINVLIQVQYGHIASVSVLVTAKTIITVLSWKRTQKRKLLNDEIEEVQKKKRYLHTDIDSLTASADEYVAKAEQTHQVSWITKSNSFRRSVKEKSTKLTVVAEQLKQKLQDVKSS